MRNNRLRSAIVVAMALLVSNHAMATVYMTVPQALEKMFPQASHVDTKRAYLTKDEIQQINRLSGSRGVGESALVTYFMGFQDDRHLGTAYLNTHVVRTLPETLLISITPSHEVSHIEVLSFNEPPDYMAPSAWMDQFKGRLLDRSLSLKHSIHGITGATLTAQSVTQAVRWSLAINQLLFPILAQDVP